MTAPILYRGSVNRLRATIRRMVSILSGHTADPTGLAEGLLLRLGMVALMRVKDAFVVKAAGGTDDAGYQWAPLKRETIAYSRRHPGLNRKRQQAEAKGRKSRPLLSNAEDKRWRQIFARALHGIMRKAGQEGAAGKEEKAYAAAYAWTVLKSEGAKTILSVYGDTKVDILRDTDVLLNSLSPGLPGDSGEVGPANANQVLRAEPGAAIVGTNVPYAAAHHHGNPKKNLPERRLWPESSRWPAAWLAEEVEQLKQGSKRLLMLLIQQEAA